MSSDASAGILQTPAVLVSRRAFIGGMFGMAGVDILKKEHYADAAELPKEDDRKPLKYLSPDGQEYDFERQITTTKVSFDPKLQERSITPIDEIGLSENSERFQNLSPNNPQDRLDLFSLWLLTGLYKYRKDFGGLQKEPYGSTDEMTTTPTGQRALEGIIPEVTLEDMMEYTNKLSDPEFTDFGTWAYDEGEVSGLSFKRRKIRTDGISINFISNPSAFNWLYDNTSAGNPTMRGFTQTINAEGYLALNIYVRDEDHSQGSSKQTPAEFIDAGFSTGIGVAGEYMVLYGGRYDLYQGFDASVYWPERKLENGFILYSTPAELVGGPQHPEINRLRYNTAPILEVKSRKIPR